MRSWTGILDECLLSLPLYLRLLIIAAFLIIMAVIARRRRFLTLSGSVMSMVIGAVVFYIGGVSGIVMLLFFFLSGSVVGKLVRGVDRIGKKGSERDMMQVAANGLPAALMLILSRISPFPITALVSFAAGIAEAEADTMASEIGMLSHKDPVSIITFTKVPKGLSGGVTVLGAASAALSSFLIAFLFMGTFGCLWKDFFIIAASGTLGALFDSFLGATVQVHYRDRTGALTEKEKDEDGNDNTRVRGIRWIDNDMVNLLSGLFSSSVAFALSLI